MKVYGAEIDFKHTRVSDARRFEYAIRGMSEANEEHKKTRHKLSESLQWQIEVYRKFFIDATGTDILKDCRDAQEAEDAYYDFLGQIQAERALAAVRRSCMAKKYEKLAEAVKRHELAVGTITR